MINGKKVIIIGFGQEAVASANFFGEKNKVAIYDDKDKSSKENKYFKDLKFKPNFYFKSLPKKDHFDLVVRSPGVRPDHQIIKRLIKSGSKLTSLTKMFFDECPCPIIAVTGTKGKGTTATLIWEMLKTQSENVYLAGNIGTPAIDILPKLNEKSQVVLELSSFQLIDLEKSPHVAVVLMITKEHLDWHKDPGEYSQAKKTIVSFQNKSDFAVINYDFPTSRQFAKSTAAKVFFFSTKQKTNGAYISKGQIVSEIVEKDVICKIDEILMPGAHNLQNVLAAVVVAKLEGIKSENIKNTLMTFKGLKFRLEFIKEVKGIKYYNDSFSTTPETTIAAIRSFPKSLKILILGGSSKKSDFSQLAKEIVKNKTLKALILMGQESERIKRAIDKAGKFSGLIQTDAKNMKEIVNLSQKMAKRGDIILLSPACASFDMFDNYEDRGNQFNLEVNKLK